MKHITAFSLIMAFIGLSPVMAADAGRTSGGERIQPDQRQFEKPLRYKLKLSPEQMDKVQGGRNEFVNQIVREAMTDSRTIIMIQCSKTPNIIGC